MTTTIRARRRFGAAAAVGASTVALVLGQLAVADAEPGVGTPVPAQAPPAPPQPNGLDRPDHAMGSQIAKHESGTGWRAAPVTRAGASGQTRFAAQQTPGLDVSHWQGRVNWGKVARMGARFAYVKATEGTGYRDPTFAHQYNGSRKAGLIRGAYHFALPNVSTGTRQAHYFVNHGGGWSADGRTLPGALDIEYNPYGAVCYGKSRTQMAAWIKGFSRTYHKRTNRWPTIYTSASWWSQCVGRAYSFHRTSPLWIARYNSYIGALPYNWPVHTIWQFNDSGRFPGDQNRFNGSMSRVRALARG